jgi:hypothetical protein
MNKLTKSMAHIYVLRKVDCLFVLFVMLGSTKTWWPHQGRWFFNILTSQCKELLNIEQFLKTN